MLLNYLGDKTLHVHPKSECKEGKGSCALDCPIFQLPWQSESSKVVGMFLLSCPVIGEECRLIFKFPLKEI